ncbi:host-nuclease inhibitor Gam family protein [Desulfovibrio sp. SGI.169]|uniref:host-nuclease inhibitor Gam family protein n=1 Tax=Desulfovibrio sp. SGI.169 TaxID=3420561 RepID=UPI003D040927
MKRVKPVPQIPAISTLEDADAVLAEIAASRRAIDLAELSLKEGVAELKARCAQECEPHRQRIAEREQILVQFAQNRREELFKTRKSLVLDFGTIGFRSSTSVKPLNRKFTWERILTLIQDRGLDAVRIKQEVDKDKLRALPADMLAEVGCKLAQSDDFFYELNEAELADTSTVPA